MWPGDEAKLGQEDNYCPHDPYCSCGTECFSRTPISDSVSSVSSLNINTPGGKKSRRSATHLADDISIREPHSEAVLGSVVLVLILRHETLPGIVVRLPLWRISSHGIITKFCQSYPLQSIRSICNWDENGIKQLTYYDQNNCRSKQLPIKTIADQKRVLSKSYICSSNNCKSTVYYQKITGDFHQSLLLITATNASTGRL